MHLVEQLCLVLNDEFRVYLPDILPRCIQVINDAERCNNYIYVLDILHTIEVFGGEYFMFLGKLVEFQSSQDVVFILLMLVCISDTGTLDEHMHFLLPVLIRLLKADAPTEIRRAVIKTLTRLIPHVQVFGCLRY